MQAKKERWRQVCEQVLVEQDPIRFQELVNQLNQLLEYKEQRLMHAARPENPLKEKTTPKHLASRRPKLAKWRSDLNLRLPPEGALLN